MIFNRMKLIISIINKTLLGAMWTTSLSKTDNLKTVSNNKFYLTVSICTILIIIIN